MVKQAKNFPASLQRDILNYFSQETEEKKFQLYENAEKLEIKKLLSMFS